MLLEVSFSLLDKSFMMFMVQTSLMIITYDHSMFIVQVTVVNFTKRFSAKTYAYFFVSQSGATESSFSP